LLVVPQLREAGNTLMMALVGVGLLAVALIFIPFFLRWFLGLRPLTDGPLRERLLATASRQRFRVSDVLVWNTRNGVANAMVTGVLPWLRYVVVTDRLLNELNEEEIEAVFGHEVGHMKHHHMFFYMVFILMSLMLLGGLWSAGHWLLRGFEAPEWLSASVGAAAWHTVAVWLILGLVAAYILVVFGWLSRRCERQADIFGAKTASPAAFVSALEKVADLNGIPRERPGFLSWWQHSTIADRIDFIERMQADPHLEPRFQRRLGWTKWGVALALTALVVTGLWCGWDLTKFM
jgi:Zn-dependent protease with chaperone function